jgi:hypothetical protein
MTTIIGVENEDGATIIADSLVVDDNGKRYNHPAMTKINKRGSFYVAGAGEIMPCDTIQHLWEPPKLMAVDKKDLWHFMLVKVLPSMRKCLKDNGYNFDEDGENRFSFIVAVGGELFEVDDNLGVTKSKEGFYGIGSGAPFALGALEAGATPEDAIAISAKLSAYTEEPFIKVFQSK